MAISDNEYLEQIRAAGIGIDEFERALILVSEEDIDNTDWDPNPAEAFKQVITLLNEQRALPIDLAAWCGRFGLVHNQPEIIIADPDDIDY